ncbi:hypothetical protein HT102_06230 [Hoyosella sp. G463]|uniref:Uncharacterized protein n=1 Tax=Lolliginicoccus lacisalsi TaxID=2742202 RepID=A0A927JB66_9ACTN|nr:hypothetical protein [Lolliginicoccus lacisalsi]MBD8506078.1 hypothetical protein [Lolliginicoccus lacisalsi]
MRGAPGEESYLGLVDMHFLRTHRGHGMPVVMQGIWMLDETVDEATLSQLHRRLAAGPLNRRVIKPLVPGARPYWALGASIAPIHYTRHALPRERVIEWADERTLTRLNPEHGIGWELSIARIADGGTIISLVCSHALTDARGLIGAVEAAVTGTRESVAGLARRRALGSELRDAAVQYWKFLIGSLLAFYTIFVQGNNRDEIVRHLRRNRVEALRRKRAATIAEKGKIPAGWREATTIIDVMASEWDAVAARSSGTPNSLLVCIVSNLMYSSGAKGLHEPVTIGMPFDTSSEEDGTEKPLRSNALTLSTLTWAPRGSRYGELFLLRDRAREAFRRTSTSTIPEAARPAAFPLATLNIVPDRVATKLTSASSITEAVASHVGTLPQSLTHLGKYPVASTAARAAHPRFHPVDALAGPLVIDACLLRNGDHYTLAVNGVDPVRFPTSRGLRSLVIKELEKWGLVPQSWDSNEPGLGIPGGPSALF